MMKLPYIVILLLSSKITQISSETELDKLTGSLLKSLQDVVTSVPNKIITGVEPLNDYYNIEDYLNKAKSGIKQSISQIEKGFSDLSNLTPEEKDNRKKIIGYLSYFVTGSYMESIKYINTVTNKSFNLLPDNIKNNIMNLGLDVNDFLKRIIKENYKDDLSKSEKNKPKE